MRAQFFVSVALLAAFVLAAGCESESSSGGTGDVRLVLSGGEAIRDGFPHTEGDTLHEFADGWSLQFEHYVISIGNVQLTDPSGGAVEAELEGPLIVDLASESTASVDLAVLTGLPAKRLDLGYEWVPATIDAEAVGVDAALVEEMAANGWTVFLEGVASNAGESVEFRVGLQAGARYRQCTNGEDGTQGFVVERNKTTSALIYSHAVHLWWDSLVGGFEADPALRFEAWAAVADADGVVTSDGLASQGLFGLTNTNGDPLENEAGGTLFYNDGGLLAQGETSLLDYVREGFRQSGHFNGLGFCVLTRTDN